MLNFLCLGRVDNAQRDLRTVKGFNAADYLILGDGDRPDSFSDLDLNVLRNSISCICNLDLLNDLR
jgi:hypothetical protein